MIFLNSRVANHRLIMINPVQLPVTPEKINVLPTLNSLTGIPKATATTPATKTHMPATNTKTIIHSRQILAQRAVAAHATITSYYVQDQIAFRDIPDPEQTVKAARRNVAPRP